MVEPLTFPPQLALPSSAHAHLSSVSPHSTEASTLSSSWRRTSSTPPSRALSPSRLHKKLISRMCSPPSARRRSRPVTLLELISTSPQSTSAAPRPAAPRAPSWPGGLWASPRAEANTAAGHSPMHAAFDANYASALQQRRRASSGSRRGDDACVAGASEEALKELDSFVVEKDDGHVGAECSVCLCGFETGEEGVVLPCMHGFHASCAKPWLSRNATCPLCRAAL